MVRLQGACTQNSRCREEDYKLCNKDCKLHNKASQKDKKSLNINIRKYKYKQIIGSRNMSSALHHPLCNALLNLTVG